MTDLVYEPEDLLPVLDRLLSGQDGQRWDRFFADRERPVPFFVNAPDENLADWLDSGVLPPGRALELGCGHGRNARFLARRGCAVDAVDFSAEALEWAREESIRLGISPQFHCASIFDFHIEPGAYDLVYDSGCFHHMAPHRRKTYVELVRRALKPHGRLGLVCFRPEGGSGLTDQQVYEEGSLRGGLGYTESSLRDIFTGAGFRVDELRIMRKGDGDRFGEEFLQVMLAAKAS